MFKKMIWIISLLVSVIFIGGCNPYSLAGIAVEVASNVVDASDKANKKNWEQEINAKFTPGVDTEQSIREIKDKNGKPEDEMLFQNEIPVKKVLVYFRPMKFGDGAEAIFFVFDKTKNQFVYILSELYKKDDYLSLIKEKEKEGKEYLKLGYVKFLNKEQSDYKKQGRYDLALEITKKLMEQKSEADTVNAEANNSVAWFFATCKDPRYRDAEKALEYAQKAVAIKRSARYLDTLAASYAENGDFAKAVELETEAYNLALDKQSGVSLEHLNSFKELIEVYRSRRTYAQWKYGEKLTSK